MAGEVLRATLVDEADEPLDDILVSVHSAPPVWDLRLHLHGSPWLIRRCTELLSSLGFRAAPVEPEERGGCGALGASAAPLWPQIDPLLAEAYVLLPQMTTLRGARWLLKQASRLKGCLETLLRETDLDRGRAECARLAARANVFDWFARAPRLALIGPPNSGKSTLANALAGRPVSLAAPLPGTTRDWVEVPGQLRGFPVIWLDTAGLRDAADPLEAAAVSRTRQLARQADGLVIVLDGAAAASERADFLAAHRDLRPACVALNKADLGGSFDAAAAQLPPAWRGCAAWVSATEQTGLDELAGHVLRGLARDESALNLPGAFSARQVRLLQAAAAAADTQKYQSAISHCLAGRLPSCSPPLACQEPC